MTILRKLKKLTKSALLVAALSISAGALPEGATIVNGNVNINTSGSTQTITQSSNKAIINWNGFNIDVGELVHFVQPSSISAILNRVVGQDPSVIMGALQSNGQVFLVNPNGVVFGQTAQIDVGSLVVSTLNIQDDDFLAGNLNFSQEADKDLAAVINHGTINIDDNGFLVLTGPMVANDGVILAKVGQVALAAGTQNTVSFDPTGMIQVALPDGAAASEGIVSLSQQAAGDILSGVIATSTTQAGQIVERDGKIFLDVQSGTVVQAGDINADGLAGQDAGTIVLDSSANTLLSADSVTSAAGQGLDSDGGNIFILSDVASESPIGSFADVSGGLSGDAGFVEQSSFSGLTGLTTDLSAADGEAGTFLIDPLRLFVDGGVPSGPGVYDMTVLEATLEGQAAGTVLLQATNGIGVGVLAGGSLTLQSGVNLVFDITGAVGDGVAAIDFESAGTFAQTQGTGTITVTSNSPEGFNNLDLRSVDGDITITAAGGGDFTGPTNFTTTGTGDITINAGTSNFTGTTTLAPGDRFSLDTNDTTLLQLNVISQLTGATTADINVDALGRNIILNGVDATGGSLSLTADSISQTNPGNVNEGTFTLSSSLGDVGSLASPIRIDGTVDGAAIGDMFLESVNSLSIGNSTFDTLVATGTSYTISGNVVGTTSIDIDAGVTNIASAGGIVNSPLTTLNAANIGAAGNVLRFEDGLRTSTTGDVFLAVSGPVNLLDVVVSGAGDIDVTPDVAADFNGQTDLVTTTGDITVNTPSANFLGTTLLSGNGDISVTSNNLNLDVTGTVVTGTSSASGVTISSASTLNLGGITNTGGTLALGTTANISQTNQVATNTGAFDLTSGVTIGSAVNPVRIDGVIVASALGDVFLESVNSLILDGVSGNNVTGTGDIFLIDGTQSASNDFSLTAAVRIDNNAPGNRINAGDTLTLIAPEIGTSGVIDFNAVTLDVTADNIDLDSRGVGLSQVNVTRTLDPSVTAPGTFFISDSGEGNVFNDTGFLISSDPVADLTLNLIGSRNFINFGRFQNTDITTVADSMGNGFLIGSLDLAFGTASLTGENVILTEVSSFMSPSVTATATSGDVTITSTSGDDIPISATATGTVDINIDGFLTSPSGISAPTVILNALDIDVGTTTADLTANSTSGNVLVTNTSGAPMALTADAFGGSGDVTITSDHDINTNNITGNVVFLNAATDPGAINRLSGTITGLTSVRLDARRGIDADTATDNLIVNGSGFTGSPVTIDNTGSGPFVDVDLTNTGGSVTFNNLGGGLEGDLDGSSLIVTNDQYIDISSNAPTVDATSTMEDLLLFLSAPTVTVTGSAVDPVFGDVIILPDGDAIVGAGGITAGTFVAFDSPGTNITSLGTIFAPALDVTAGGDVQFNLFQTTDVDVVVDGSIDVSNASAVTVDLLLVSLVQGDITYSNGLGPANIEKVYAPEGNIDISSGSFITALTDPGTINIGEGFNPPGNTIAAFDPAMDDSGGTVTLNGVSINANVTAERVTATSSTGNIILNGNDNTAINIDATSTMGGNVTINETGDVTGTLDGTSVTISANSLDIDLGAGVPLVDATATAGLIDILANSADLQVTALATSGDPVVVNNTGGNIATNQMTGDTISVTAAGDITRMSSNLGGFTSVTLDGLNITAQTDTPSIIASSNGNVDITSVSLPFFPTTANIVAAGSVDLATTSDTFLNTVSGTQVNITADGGGQATAGLTGTVTATTGLDIRADNAFLNVDSPVVTGALMGMFAPNLNITGNTPTGMDINVLVPGTSTITNTGDVTGTLRGTTVDVMAANINAITTSPDIIATALAPGTGTITLSGVQTVTATADANINLSSFGPIVLNDITSATGDVDISSTSGTVTSNVATSISGDLVDVFGQGVDINTQAQRLDIISGGFTNDLVVNNTGTDLTNTTLFSDRDITLLSDGNVAGLNVSAFEDVTLEATGSVLGGGTVTSRFQAPIDLTAGSIANLDIFGDLFMGSGDQTVTFNTTLGDADINGVGLDNLNISGTAAGDAIISADTIATAGLINVGLINAANINIQGGAINQTAGRLTTPGTVTLNAGNINATTDASAVDATSTSGDIILDNDSALVVPLDVTLNSARDITFTTNGDADFISVTGQVVSLSSGGTMTGTVAGSTSLNLIASNDVTLDFTSPVVTTDLTGMSDLDLTSTSPIATNFDVMIANGSTIIDHVGDVSGTLQGSTLDVTAANIDILTASPVATAVATSPTGTIDIGANVSTLELTATANGNIGVNNVGGRFGGGNILANTITSGGDITLTADGDFVRTNPGETLVGNLVTINAHVVDVDTQATGLDVTTSPSDFPTDIFVRNTVTDLDPVNLDSAGDIFFSTTGNVDNLDATGGDVNIAVTDSTISGGTAAATGTLTITGGTVATLDVITDVLAFSTTLGDANFTGMNADLALVGSSAGGVSVVNTGNIMTGPISGTSISLDTQSGGDITTISGQLTSPGLVNLDANNVSAQTDAGSLTANAAAGDINIDNFSANVDPVTLTATGTVNFTSTGDANFGNTAGTTVNLQGGALTGTVGASTLLDLMGTSIDVDLGAGTPVVVADASAGPIDILANSANLEITATAPVADSVVINNTGGNVATNRVQGDAISITANGDITRVSDVLAGTTSVTLSGDNIQAQTDTSSVTATSTSGDIDVFNVSLAPLTANLTTTGMVDLVAEDDINLNTVSGGQVNITANNGGNLTGTVTGTTGLDLNAASATLNVDSPVVTGTLSSGNLDITGSTLAGMDIDVIVPGTSTITNTGDVTGTLRGTSVDVSAANINANVETSSITATATTGSVDLTSATGTPLDIATSAVTTTTVNHNGALTGSLTGGTFADLDATSINVNLTPASGPQTISADATGDVTVTANQAALGFSSVSSGNVMASNTGGDIATAQVTGSSIDISASGDITRNSGNLNAPSVTLAASNIDAQTFTSTLNAVGDGNVTVDNVLATPLSAVIASTTAGNVSLMTDGDLTVDRGFSANGNLDINAVGTITATADPTLTLINGSVPAGNTLAAPNGTITVTGSGADINVTTSNLVATANNQNLNITGTDNANINIDANATNGNITVMENGDVTGDFNAINVDVTANSIDVDLGVGVSTVLANSTGGLIDLLANSANLEVTAIAPIANSVVINNTGGNVATNRVQGDTIAITANGDITRVSDVLAGTTSVTLSGDNIQAQTDTGSVTATSTSGDIDVTNVSIAPLTANLVTTGMVDLVAEDDINLITVSGGQVNITANNSGALTGTATATTGLGINAGAATLNVTSPSVSGNITGNLDITGSSPTMDFSTLVSGTSMITNTGDVTGTLNGTTVDVTGANINAATTSPDITATATAPGTGTITLTGVQEVTATAPGDVDLSDTGAITLNNISGSNVNVTSTGGAVTSNGGTSITGGLVTVSGTAVDIDTQATGLNLNSSSGDVTVDNTVTDLDPTTISSFNDIFFTTTGAADNLNVSGNNVNITATTATLTGGTATATGSLNIVAGTINNLAVVTDTLVIDTRVGDASFTGTNADLAVSGTSAGAVNVVNTGNISTGQINGTSITLDTQGGGDITNTAGRLTTAGNVALDGNNVSAQTEAGSVTANASAGNVDIDNFSANLDPVSLTATGTVDFNTTGDANFTSTSGTLVNLQADGALTGAASATSSLALDGNSVNMSVVTPALSVTSATGFNVQGGSADMTVSGSTSAGDATVSNTGNIATDSVSGDNVNLTSTTGNITRNSGALTANPGGTVNLSAGDISAETNADVVIANATAGNVDIDSNIPFGITLSGSATGTFTANQNGFLTVGDITANTIDLTTTSQGFGNPISSATNTSLTANQINLDGGQVTVVTSAAGFDVRSDTSVVINNTGPIITSGTLVGGASDNITLTNDDDITGVTATAQSVSLVTLGNGDINATANASTRVLANGDSVTLNMTGTELQGIASTGDLNVTANSVDLDTFALANNGDTSVTNTGGGIRVNQVSGQNVTLDTQNNRGIIQSAMGPGTITATTSASLSATDITATIITPVVTANTNGGDVSLTGSNPNLSVTADAMGGDIVVNNTGNIATNNINGGDVTLDTRTGGVPQGEITRTSGTITANNLTLEGTNVTANTSVSTITANAPGDITITNTGTNITQANLIAGGNVGLITDGTANLNTFQGTGITLSVAQAVTGALSGNTVDVTGTDINVSVTPVSGNSTVVVANSTAGNVQVAGNTADLTITASADNGGGPGTGTVAISNSGNIATNAITGSDVSIDANGGAGDITNASGRITGSSSVSLNGNDVTASTSTASLTAQNANTITIDNDSASLTPTLGASGAVNLSSTGAISGGALTGSSLVVNAQSIGSSINTQSVETNSSNGNTTLSSSGSGDLTVVNSTATNGDYTLTHGGNITFDRIEADNVTIDAGLTGNITDTSNTIVATGITLTGNNILVNTQGQIIVVSAQGEVTISNTLVDVSSLSVDAQGNVTFGTEGDLTITQVAGGPLVSLQADNNINANPGAVVSGTDVILQVGGQITPDLDNPLDVQATNSIEVIAPFGGPVLSQSGLVSSGGSIAAALEGIIPASSVVVSSSSGPVFYNGILLNPTGGSPPVIPPVVPPSSAPAINQIGQQNGQVIDDGSVGSAANDGLVENSPTQELVAQLTETAGGGGGGGATTEMLVTMEVDELGELQVTLGEPSPFDAPIDSSETMTADDILDLDTGELNDVKVAVYYDAGNDQLVMAVDLRADDVMDLEVGDYQEIPINLEYSFLSDPKLIIDKLRADDIIDLRVEDLGLIPIKINVYEDDDEDEDEVEEEILKQKKKKEQGETE